MMQSSLLFLPPTGSVHHGGGGVQLQTVLVSGGDGGGGLQRHVKGGREGHTASGLHPDHLPAQVPDVPAGQILHIYTCANRYTQKQIYTHTSSLVHEYLNADIFTHALCN